MHLTTDIDQLLNEELVNITDDFEIHFLAEYDRLNPDTDNDLSIDSLVVTFVVDDDNMITEQGIYDQPQEWESQDFVINGHPFLRCRRKDDSGNIVAASIFLLYHYVLFRQGLIRTLVLA